MAAGDEGSIRIGSNSNIQDNSTIQSNKSFLGEHHGPTRIGDSVTVGHGVFMDSVTIEDEALIGMGATLLQGVKVLPDATETLCNLLQAQLRLPGSGPEQKHTISPSCRSACVRVATSALASLIP